MLTSRQRDLLVFINDRLTETGVSPSFAEMKDGIGLRSKSGIHRLLFQLEERGFIRRLHFRNRAIEVLRLPANGAMSAPNINALVFRARRTFEGIPQDGLAWALADVVERQQAGLAAARELLRWHRNEGADTDEPPLEFVGRLSVALDALDAPPPEGNQP